MRLPLSRIIVEPEGVALKTRHQRDATTGDTLSIKIENNEGQVPSAPGANTSKGSKPKAKKKSTTRPKIDLNLDSILDSNLVANVKKGVEPDAEASKTLHRRFTTNDAKLPIKENNSMTHRRISLGYLENLRSRLVIRLVPRLVARKSDDYPKLNELPDEAEPVIYKEINKDKDTKTPKPKKSKKKSTTTRPKIDLNNPCASCPARDTKSDRFVDGEGT